MPGAFSWVVLAVPCLSSTLNERSPFNIVNQSTSNYGLVFKKQLWLISSVGRSRYARSTPSLWPPLARQECDCTPATAHQFEKKTINNINYINYILQICQYSLDIDTELTEPWIHMNPLDSQASIALLDGRRLLLFSLSGSLVTLPLILESVRFRIPKNPSRHKWITCEY